MTFAVTRHDLEAALPDVRSPLRLRGLDGPCEVWRDPQGIPHVRAGSTRDAFFAQGFVHAQDRLWQMDYDRRRAYGRWAEYAGAAALPQDIQMRRCRLGHSARADYEAVNAETRAVLDAYADGVNAFIHAMRKLPVEYLLVGGRPEPWRPWDAGAVFKVRHILMGVWQLKVWRARLVRQLGAAEAARLCPGTPPNPVLIVPPGLEYRGPAADGAGDLTQAENALRALPDWEQGSNSWALAGTRTASGKPLVAGDPHRSLDVPNVYYQNHIACDEFDAVGLSFPGVPGFPHFGHNRSVAWCVTHTHADYQDLFIEHFDTRGRYEFRGQWRTPETTREIIHVRGGGPVEIDVTVTHHGPLLLGDPTSGTALALRYTATAEPNATFDALLPMLRTTSADELLAAIRPWVDPVNNFVFADVHGAIGYKTRGKVPLRAKANAWVPVRGWDGTHEWRGMIPFEEMPEIRNPATGWIVTANSKVTGPDYPHYLGLDYAPDFRTRRIAEQLRDITGATVADMMRIHGDRVSLPARAFIELVSKVDVAAAAVQRALDALRGWDGRMERDAVAPTIYSVFREHLMRDLMAQILGPLHGEAFAASPRGAVTHMARLRARLPDMIRSDDRTLRPDGDWPGALRAALESAVRDLTERFGPDMSSWRWGRLHATQPQHTLSASFPELARLLDPPSQPLGGDGDTVQAASYIAGNGYGVTSTSVARYVFDLGDWERSGWVVPLGASGHPGSPHYADQASPWVDVRLLPMRYDWPRIRAEAESHQTLDPA